jgi:multidrug efflux pump subunit AcrB
LGQDFFPSTDGGNFILHVRGKTGLRIEETARLCDLVEQSIRQTIPAGELDNILDNIGLPYSGMNTMHLTSGIIGASDADVMVTLKPHHQPTANYVRALRASLPRNFPSATFYFLPADITTQILNFGLPAPIDVQFRGNDVETSAKLAADLNNQLRQVPGLVDLRVQQPMDYPTYNVDIDRTKAEQGGYAARDVGQSMLNTLSGSFQISPMFFLNWKNGVDYQLVAQTPQYRMQSIQDLQNIPVNVSGAKNPEVLADVASIQRGDEMAVISEYNMRRVVDIYGAVQGRDLGGVSRDVARIVNAYKKNLPRGTTIEILGQVDTMRSSYISLIGGLLFSIVLVYMLIVVNFQSWLDPFIIITALPAALAGIVLFLFYTHAQRSRTDGGDYVHGSGDGKQHSDDLVREDPLRRTSGCRSCGDRGRPDSLPPGMHDRPGDDYRHDPDGSWPRRRRRTECAAGTRGDRRIDVRHRRHSCLCAVCLCAVTWPQIRRPATTRITERYSASARLKIESPYGNYE